ncbi:MAG: carbamoyltransferase C-terminal domain-containing protein [Candidatus Kaelpia imicola]|nr:carbamoyltransferase C-terminal domain-containing protein [Candidatus Kaelpia imicola]
MKILGIAAPFGHDSSAALIVDGKIVAAVEEERFTRKKHAEGQLPLNSVKYCLEASGLRPEDIDIIAYPWAVSALRSKRREYLFRTFKSRPSRAYKKFFRNRKEFNDQINFINKTLSPCGFDTDNINIRWVEHHTAHAASSFYLSGMSEAAYLSIDAGGEIVSTLIGKAKDSRLTKIKEIIAPDSLGDFYATMTDYLGFRRGNGEYKVMGMAPYGDPDNFNFDHIINWIDRKKSYCCNDDYVWVQRSRRFKADKVYSKKMVDEFGLEREGEGLSEPYIHIAAVTQKKLEDITVKLIDTYLKDELERHGNLCFAGGCALNVALNRVLLKLPYIKRLFVQPASHDSGGSLGAAAFAAVEAGDRVEVMNHVYYGPEYSNSQIEGELKRSGLAYKYEDNIAETVADLLCQDEIVGWFQGRMEWGPRALGARSIIGNPTIPGTADRINALIKFREKWRPFCPSILREFASDILNSDHPAPFMAIAFDVNESWREKIPEVVHVNGTCRPQIVDEHTNLKYYKLIKSFQHKTGVPVVINTSLNRKGEPIVCTPHDAVEMFKGSGLEYMAIGDYLVWK